MARSDFWVLVYLSAVYAADADHDATCYHSRIDGCLLGG